MELFDFQIETLAFYFSRRRSLNLSDPGAKKTPPTCVYMGDLANRGIKSYFVQPKALLDKNLEEMLLWSGLKEEEVAIVDGTPSQRKAIMNRAETKVFLMGFKRFADDWQTMRAAHPELNSVVVDEVHMGFANYQSARTKQLVKAMKQLDYFTGLTGTLIDGSPKTAYPMLEIIAPQYYRHYWAFLQQHAVKDDWGTIVGWRHHNKIKQILNQISIRYTFEQVCGKVKVDIQYDRCTMHPKQAKAYEEMETLALVELEDDFLEGEDPAINALRCRQILAHPESFGILNEGEMTGKDEHLAIHIEDAKQRGEQLIIFSSLIPEQERIAKMCNELGMKAGVINSNNQGKSGQIDSAFRRGELRVVVCGPASASVGFNWGFVNHVIFASLDYKNSNFVQAYRRAIRGSRTKPLRITLMVYRNAPVERRMFQVIDMKSRQSNKIDPSYEVLNLSNYKD